MTRLDFLIADSKELHNILHYASKEKAAVNVSGVTGTGVAALSALISNEKRQCAIMTSSHDRGKKLCADLAFFVGKTDKKIFLLPDENQFLIKYEAKSHAEMEQRLAAVSALLKNEPCIIVGTPESLLKRTVPKGYFTENILEFEVGKDSDPETVRMRLTRMGYERTIIVEAKGQYSIRGGIIDIYPPSEENPVRIELFDTEVDSIRFFDMSSQRSLDRCENIAVYPAQQMVHDEERFKEAAIKIEKSYEKAARSLTQQSKKKIIEQKERLIEFIGEGINLQFLENYLTYFYDETETILDYANQGLTLVVDDLDRIQGRMSLFMEETRADYDIIIQNGEAIAEDFHIEYMLDEFLRSVDRGLTFFLNPFAKTNILDIRLDANLGVVTKQGTAYYGNMELLAEEIKRYRKRKFKIMLSASSEERIQNLKDFLDRHEIPASAVNIMGGDLTAGIEFTEERIAIISDKDIFIATKRKKSFRERKDAKPIKSFTEIKQGDFVVHEHHGIGKFIGIEQKNFQGVIKDYLKIKYAGEDFLYVPVGQMDFIQKYIGSEGNAPRVNKLTGSEWKKTKLKAKIAIAQMAKELMEISAKRRMIEGYSFGPDTQWQHEFEDLFPYVETGDQLRCIKEIKQDMEKPEIMERLLCGDVGYGKTEVAARAAFKCAAEGKQVAVLVPTTILANQHYHTFMKRFEKFPMQIEMLSRFRSDKQQKEIIEKTKHGKYDILIGTHRILSKDVEFKDLGLLIIDEEHRFGVQHKEVIKSLKSKVDVLTLSATPIPRTLHMSLSGIRNMSVIEEPPEERYPVQTYVLEQDDEVLREIIRREIERDGQVFVVYNRVQGIKKIAAQIQALVPEATIAVGHGQMNEKELEDIMVDFVDNKYNVLVATTIIESGIDIPNANTMIILDSDRFGLSQLYQLRGRVGRSSRMAYAYLFYQRNKVLTEVAEKRLRAIREFTEFGSGFKIAMRDLEIRGAGNLLGTEQSGHMMTIGYELYCKLLDDAVKALQGKGSIDEEDDDLPETSIEIRADAYISDEYISDEVLKLQMYKKISEIRNEGDELEVKDELLDRFGDLPKSTENLICASRIKAMARDLGIEKVGEKGGIIALEFYEKNKLKPEKISDLIKEYGPKITVHAGRKPQISWRIAPKQNIMKETKDMLTKLWLA